MAACLSLASALPASGQTLAPSAIPPLGVQRRCGHADPPGGTAEQAAHARRLRTAMERRGFTVLPTEWWHFDWNGWTSFPPSLEGRPIRQVVGLVHGKRILGANRFRDPLASLRARRLDADAVVGPIREPLSAPQDGRR